MSFQTTVSCYSCGTEFGMPNGLYQQRLRDHKTFYCPNVQADVATHLAESHGVALDDVKHLLEELSA